MFRRFVSRRGRPSCIWSDNGSNFVGAKSSLKELERFLQQQGNHISEHFDNKEIRWNFILARAPNFGGLWEAGVKSYKNHLKRVMENAFLNFENLEATLNSRPLTQMCSVPNNFDILTPAHFLIGRQLTSVPDPSLKGVPENRLSKFQHLQNWYQHFWTRWSKEYIHLLQQRTKWTQPQRIIKVGELVIIKKDNLPPLECRMGRITNVYYVDDDNCRVASMKTSTGSIKRAISKICTLPMEEDIVCAVESDPFKVGGVSF